ncbi:methyltransferase domain-containing protein [Kribbella sp. NPDC050124]|uniref:methyltransferase domain-containing protein n=1 Tax=Kribbella sp. NPDC050124 TaxID=3364114 RepID=UPI0037910B17
MSLSSQQVVDQQAVELRGKLVESLVAEGAITDEAWRAAFRAVPRHLLVPRFYQNTSVGSVKVDASAGDHWLSTVYSDTHLVTRDDVTSSSTAPSLMAAMLEALDLSGDETVLEVGTGTGYNAALLSERLSDARVVSVDIDSQSVDDARRYLATAGYHPLLVATDGVDGFPGRAPYDRIIATCRLDYMPSAWLEQLQTGGVVVTPLGAGVARVVKHGDGTASGAFLPTPAYFMPLRHHPEQIAVADLIEAATRAAGSTRNYTHDTTIYRDNNARFWLDLTQPDVRTMQLESAAIAFHPDGSWARLAGGTVTQGGARNLWDDVEFTHDVWLDAGSPERVRYRLDISTKHQHVLLDDLTDPVHELLPRGSDGG